MNKLFDKDLTFEEESHIYSLKSDPDFIFVSSTTFIHNFFPKFEKEKIAKRLADKPKYKNHSEEDLIAEWGKAAKEGTEIHQQLEKYVKNKRTRPKSVKAKQGVIWLKSEIKPDWELHSEVMIYSTELGIAGMMDLLVYNPKTDMYAIVDWKTNKKIYTQAFRGKKGIRGSTADLDDCNYIHYSLQLSLYRYILEEYYGLNIASTVIVHLQEDAYKEYKCEYLKYSIAKMIRDKNANGLY